MAQTIGRNFNRNDTASVTTVEVNSVTATKIADANPKRTFLEISLISIGSGDIALFTRLYPASDDNIKRGIPIGVASVGVGRVFNITWRMPPDNIYTGEVSAITNIGTTTVNITEY